MMLIKPKTVEWLYRLCMFALACMLGTACNDEDAVKDSSLEMNVIVQSVPADRITECWNVTLTDGLIDITPAY